MEDTFVLEIVPPETAPSEIDYGHYIVIAGFVVLGVFLLVHLFRTWRARHVNIDAQWSMLEKMAQDRGLGEKEWDLLKDIVRRWSSHSPLNVVTIRARFEECVESEMNAILAENNPAHFREVGILLRGVREALGFDAVPLGHRMQSTREMRSQQVIWVAAPNASGTPQWVKGVVVAVDEAYFYASLDEGTPVSNLKIGGAAKCWLWREDDARYAFNATLATVEGAPKVYAFVHATSLQRMQSRAYYRLHVNQETTLGILAMTDENDEGFGEPTIVTRIRARLSSLSAGGCAAVAQQAPSQNAILRVAIAIPDEEQLEANTRVIAVETLPGGRFLVRMEFVNLRDEYRDIIAKYILRSQLPLSSLKETPARAME